MALPKSFAQEGFLGPALVRNKIKLANGQYLKPMLIGTQGESDTGKTEFALSIPGNIQMICVDRNWATVFDNPTPPESRNPNVAIKEINIPLQGTAEKTDYERYYKEIRECFYKALVNTDSSVVVVDGDSDFWEIQILAYFGRTTQIFPQTKYAAPYGAKRAQIARAHDSGKIVLFSNKVKDEYKDVLKPDGTVLKDDRNETVREKTGNKERQGFKDQDYLWNVQLHHLIRRGYYHEKLKRQVPTQWGVRIIKCKHNVDTVGMELWGDDCNFKGLVSLIYPDVPLERWGF